MWQIHSGCHHHWKAWVTRQRLKPEEASVIVLNTCVVRQSAENKAYGRLSSLAPLKKANPDLVINLMGCLVGFRSPDKLRERFPYVDVFSPPSDPGPLLTYLTQDETRRHLAEETRQRNAWMDEDLPLPEAEHGTLISAHIPVGAGMFPRMHILHHPLPAGRGTQPPGRRYL